MLVEAKVWTLLRTDRGSAVLVKPLEATRVVPIFIDTLEIRSIRLGLGKVVLPRPLSHDLMLGIFEKLHLVVDRVEINDLQDGIFYARIIGRQGMKKYVFDSRPSDALSIAVRVDCPVYIAEFIVDEAGIPETMFTEAPEISPTELEELMSVMDEDQSIDTIISPESTQPQEDSPLTTIRDQLEQQLAAAVAVENYEKAAAIRDEITDLDRMTGRQTSDQNSQAENKIENEQDNSPESNSEISNQSRGGELEPDKNDSGESDPGTANHDESDPNDSGNNKTDTDDSDPEDKN